MQKFFALQKVDESSGRMLVTGVATKELLDKDRELCDYWRQKSAYQAWSEEATSSTRAAGQQISLGNIRYQHTGQIAGKVTALTCDDATKTISLTTEPVDDGMREQIRGGFLRGFSQAGRYIFRACNACGYDMLGVQGNYCVNCGDERDIRYAAKIVEVSYVDSPCLESAVFTHIKADGTTELRKFQGTGENLMKGNKFSEAVARAANAHKALSVLHGKMADASTGAVRSFHKAAANEYTALSSAHTDISALVAQDLGVLHDPPTYPDSDFKTPQNGDPSDFQGGHGAGTFDPVEAPLARVAKQFQDYFRNSAAVGSINYGERLVK